MKVLTSVLILLGSAAFAQTSIEPGPPSVVASPLDVIDSSTERTDAMTVAEPLEGTAGAVSLDDFIDSITLLPAPTAPPPSN